MKSLKILLASLSLCITFSAPSQASDISVSLKEGSLGPCSDYWPDTLRPFLTSQGYESGIAHTGSVGQGENVYLNYAGDQKAFQAFLEHAREISEGTITVVIHPRQTDRATCDWRVSISHPKIDLGDNLIEGAIGFVEQEVADSMSVEIHVYLGRRIQLEGLKVPPNVGVKAGGQIGRFRAGRAKYACSRLLGERQMKTYP